MKKKLKMILLMMTAAIVALVIGVGIYLNDYYHAEQEAWDYFNKPLPDVLVYEENNLTVFRPMDPDTGLIFYPGGKVEAMSYAPLLGELAKQGVLTILVEMPGNLAVLDMNAADGIQEDFSEIEEWYLAGHSLGGSMAASYLEKNGTDYEGLILLASYSTADLSATDLDVLSLYGDQDGVLNMEKYGENRGNLPADFEEVMIEGGCHAYFGSYGAQEGDGPPAITRAEQRQITLEKILEFIED